MKIDMNQVLIGYEGKPVTDGDGEITLRHACGIALTATNPEEKIDPEEKMKRFLLAQRIYGNGSIKLTAEEIVLLKQSVGKGYSPAIVGPVWLLLDPPEPEEEAG